MTVGEGGCEEPAGCGSGAGAERITGEDLLRALVADVPEYLLAVDRDRRVIFVNRHDQGFAESSVVGQLLESLALQPDRALVRERTEHVFQTGEPTSYELPLDTPTGERRWYVCRLAPIWLGSVVERVSVVVTDVTETRRAREATLREQQFLGALELVNRAAATATDAEELIDHVLEAVLEVFDCDRAFLIKPCDPNAESWSVQHEQARPGFEGPVGVQMPMAPSMREHMRAMLAAPGALRRDPEHFPFSPDSVPTSSFSIKSALHMVIRPQGSEPWFFGLHHCTQPRVYGPEVHWFETIGARLTDGLNSALARRELAQSEARFRTLFEHAPEAIVILDAETKLFVDANRNAEELFGYGREQLRRFSPLDLSPPRQADGRDSAESMLTYVQAALAGEAPTFEWEHRHISGKSVWCEIRLVRMPDTKRKLIRGSATDISARKVAEAERARLNEQLFQAQKMQALGQLTGGVAHDFNNLLMVIVASLSMMEIQTDNPEMMRTMIGHAAQAADRAGALVDRLLSFARRQPLRPRVVDLNRLVDDMQSLIGRTLGGLVDVQLRLEPVLWSCEVDQAQLETALLDLVLNSRDAMPDGGVLSIRTRNVSVQRRGVRDEELDEGQYVALEVADTGTGMSTEVREQVFEPFFTTKEVGQGSGLGLSMVYGFVRQSHGHVRIDSEPGRGTSVTLFFPRTESPARAEPPTSRPLEAEPRGSGQSVLVVEDDPKVLRLTVAMVEGLGYACRAASTAAEAMSTLATADPPVHLLLSDVRLAGSMDGTELARTVMERYPDLPVLLMSGYARDGLEHRAEAEGAPLFLQKPFSRQALADALWQSVTAQSPESRPGPG